MSRPCDSVSGACGESLDLAATLHGLAATGAALRWSSGGGGDAPRRRAGTAGFGTAWREAAAEPVHTGAHPWARCRRPATSLPSLGICAEIGSSPCDVSRHRHASAATVPTPLESPRTSADLGASRARPLAARAGFAADLQLPWRRLSAPRRCLQPRFRRLPTPLRSFGISGPHPRIRGDAGSRRGRMSPQRRGAAGSMTISPGAAPTSRDPSAASADTRRCGLISSRREPASPWISSRRAGVSRPSEGVRRSAPM
jgi:hypothetical protein